MDTIKECFNKILCGSKSESSLAARKVRKLLYSSHNNQYKYKDIKNLINNASDEYVKISEEWRQENFIVAISVIYYLHDEEKQLDFLFPWFFQLLQHPNGIIRYAAVRMISNEIGPLTVHIRFSNHVPGYFGKLTSKQADSILNSLFVSLNVLLNALWRPKYKKYKYINSLPVSPYKSVQMVLVDLEESCGRKYVNHLPKQSLNNNIGIA